MILVKDIRPGRSGSIQGAFRGGGPGPQLANISGTLYFSADDGRHGHELWRSDGTRKGTRMVKDINPGSAGSLFQTTSLSSGTPFYFAADDGTHGFELWRSDGTEAGAMMVKDLYPGAGFYGIYGLTNVDGTLYFGVPGPPSQGLWRSDGTEAGTVLVKQIIGPRNLTDVHGILYFGGAGDDPTFKIGLWRSDGTTAGTTNIKEGVVPTEITDVNGTLYFAVADGALTGLWRSDGTEAGTEMVKAIIDPAGPDGRDLPQDLTDVTALCISSRRPASTFPKPASCGVAMAPRRGRPRSSRSTSKAGSASTTTSPPLGATSTSPPEGHCGAATGPREERPSSKATARPKREHARDASTT